MAIFVDFGHQELIPTGVLSVVHTLEALKMLKTDLRWAGSLPVPGFFYACCRVTAGHIQQLSTSYTQEWRW